MKPRIILTTILGALLLGALFMGRGVAAEGAEKVEGVERADISRALVFLQGLSPQSGAFTQTSANGGVARGKFWLDFPAYAKFVYASSESKKEAREKVNAPIITISAPWINVQARAGAEPNRFPIAATPLAILQKNKKDYAAVLAAYLKAFYVSAADKVHEKNARVAVLELRDSDNASDSHGALTLYFNASSRALLGWQVVDIQNQITQVRLFDVQYAKSLPRRLFFVQIDEPQE